MEHTSDEVADGKLLHETSYSSRAENTSEFTISSTLPNGINLVGKIDFFNHKEKCLYETKRRNSVEEPYEWQVKYYLWLLQLNGIHEAEAVITYPTTRQIHRINLLASDIPFLENTVQTIIKTIESTSCPPLINKSICKRCSYFDFCYTNEIIEEDS